MQALTVDTNGAIRTTPGFAAFTGTTSVADRHRQPATNRRIVNNQLWWYVARSGGIVAWALLAGSVLWGLALSTKVLRGRPRPNWILDLHRFLGGLALVFTGIHVGSLILDSYVHFGLVEVLVPFTGAWHPVAVAWGVIVAVPAGRGRADVAGPQADLQANLATDPLPQLPAVPPHDRARPVGGHRPLDAAAAMERHRRQRVDHGADVRAVEEGRASRPADRAALDRAPPARRCSPNRCRRVGATTERALRKLPGSKSMMDTSPRRPREPAERNIR